MELSGLNGNKLLVGSTGSNLEPEVKWIGCGDSRPRHVGRSL